MQNLKVLFLALSLIVSRFVLVAQVEIEQLPEYPLKTISDYCQSDTSKLISVETVIYDDNKLPIESIVSSSNLNKKSIKKFSYGSNQKISKITLYIIEDNLEKESVTKTYKYDSNGNLIYYSSSILSDTSKIIKFTYNEKGELSSKLLIGKDWAVNYQFKYDVSGRLIDQLRDSKPYLKFYYNKGGKLIKIVQQTNESPIETVLKYDQNDWLISKEIVGRNTEKNIYKMDGKKLEQWSSDFSKDACIEQPCCMKWVKKFKYY